MTEQAFIIDPESQFAKDYFFAKSEREKFVGFAYDFFEKYNLGKPKFRISESLQITITNQQKELYKGQIKKYQDGYGLWHFKKSSALQKAWSDKVVCKVNMKAIDKQSFWYLPYLTSGSFALWDYSGKIYGLLESKSGEVKLADFMNPIKMSEYYTIIEESENEQKGD